MASITLPASLTKIKSETFTDCTALKSIVIPDSIAEIGEKAFEGCASLASVTIPDSVTKIGEKAFDGCPKLLSLTVPKSVTTIGYRAFGTEVKRVIDYSDGYKLEICGPIEGFTLYGYYGSEAEEYSTYYYYSDQREEEDIHFVSIDPRDLRGKIVVTHSDLTEHSVTVVQEEDLADYSSAMRYLKDYYPEGYQTLGAYKITYCASESAAATSDEVTPNRLNHTKVHIRTNCPDAEVYYFGSYTFSWASTTYKNGWLTFGDSYNEDYSGEVGIYVVVTGKDTVTPACGDFDGDGELDTTDVTFIQRTIAGMMTDVDEKTRRVCDVDGNGELEITDSTYIQRYLALMDTPYPVGERF